MVAIIAALAGAAIQLVKWAAKPIKSQFNYLCCFTSNIDGLKLEAEELDLATIGLQGLVDRETENLRVVVPQVSSWFDKCRSIKEQKETILDEVPNVKKGCLKLRARYSLSRRAKKATDLMKELRGQKNFDPVATEGPPAATQETPLGRVYEFESRKKLEQDIIATLRDGDVNMIGICGMGGLGKTTMAQRIMNKVLKEKVFEEVGMVVVSQQVDKSSVQVEIGESLGLHLQHDCSQARVQKLHARLTGTKRILLILDDVWEALELESLGIPRGSKGCKVLVTSRNEDALSEMDVQKIFGMEILPPEDAWFLFRERAGTCVDDNELYPIAKEVVDECGGLPIALTTVGASLKDEKDAYSWSNALRQLRQCDQDIPDFLAKVYNPLKLSYDFLRPQQAKTILLLCSLFPEDAKIPLDELTYCCMGLGIFKGIMNLKGARSNMRDRVKMLKRRSLLLDGFNEDYVRMHDVVRDVCKIIAKQEGFIGGNDRAWLSSSELIGERTSGLGFPNLRLLLSTRTSEFKFDHVFPEGIRDLHVLWIESSPLTSLPLGNLNTLVLDGCLGLKTISVIGELVNLEILICHNCNSIEELPAEIKGLNRLKLLDLTGCYKLQSIGRDIISSLVGLEELKMLNSFNKWESEDQEERKNAGLKELQALTNLTCLEIEIEDPALVAHNMHISTKSDRFCITFPTMISPSFKFNNYNKKMSLNLERETCLGHWIEMQLLRETESLCLQGNGAKNVDLSGRENIKSLILRECEMVKNIVPTSPYDDDVDATVFPDSLEYMVLCSLPHLQEVSISFQNLFSITITDCPNLAKLSIPSGKDCLTLLEELRIERCEMMEQVLLWKEEENNNGESKAFPKLKEVWLVSLPNLVTFCQGIEGIEFPLLTKLFIKDCPKWTSMDSMAGKDCLPQLEKLCIERCEKMEHVFLCKEEDNNSESRTNPHVKFPKLKEVRLVSLPNLVTFCQGIEGIELPLLRKIRVEKCLKWTSMVSMAGKDCLPQLEKLCIRRCEKMEHVFLCKEENNSESRTNPHVKFPKLKEVCLYSLPNLVTFGQGIEGIELPLLRKIRIEKCPKWTSMASCISNEDIDGRYSSHIFCQLGKVSFGNNLEELRIDRNPFCGHEISASSSYSGLTELKILKYHGSRSLLSSTIAANLVNLKTLIVKKCDEMVQVIKEDEETTRLVLANTNNGGERAAALFPKLEELELVDIPKLVSFCEWKCDVVLPSLWTATIKKCPNIKNLSLGFVAAPNLESFTTDFNHQLGVNVSFGGLKTLTIEEERNVAYTPFYLHKFFISLVDNGLEELNFDGLKSMILFPYSIARKLMDLRSLKIIGCDEMVKVIEEDEEDEVVSGGTTTLLFPKLEELRLGWLPKLVSFCESQKHVVELPSLRKVTIIICPNMKSFTLGHLTAPNLKSININLKDFDGDQRDLDAALQQLNSAEAKVRTAHIL